MKNNRLLKVISFLFPLIGLIIYAVNVGKNEDLAKESAKWALIGVVTIPIICLIIWAILYSAYKLNLNKNIQIKSETKLLENVPIELKYNKEAYSVNIEPNVVNVEVNGKASDIYLLSYQKLIIDLNDYEPNNTYEIEPKYEEKVFGVTYKVVPNKVKVTISDTITKQFNVTMQIKNGKNIEDKETLTEIKVIVKGDKKYIDLVDKVVAIIDMNNYPPNTTSINGNDIKLNIYDKDGRNFNDILECVPNSLNGTITIDN